MQTKSVPVIKVEGVHKKLGKQQILKDINLQIAKGEIFGLLGPNGAGKSTLLSIITNILKPDKGTIFINNKKQSEFKNYKMIGYVPQEIALYPSLSAYDNLIFWANMYNLKNKKKLAYEILEFLSLTDVAKKPVFNFSSGMKRRLNIGISLIHSPDIIILDEPTVGIDLASKTIILKKILELKKQGKTFIFTTHNPDEPYKICDKIGVLKEQRIQHVGRLENVLAFYNKKSIEDLMT